MTTPNINPDDVEFIAVSLTHVTSSLNTIETLLSELVERLR